MLLYEYAQPKYTYLPYKYTKMLAAAEVALKSVRTI